MSDAHTAFTAWMLIAFGGSMILIGGVSIFAGISLFRLL